jgi:hypothetical protein
MASILDRIKDKQLASQTADAINYGRGIMAARAANNPNIDSQGFNRDILNQMYGDAMAGYAGGANRNTQAAINTVMDLYADDEEGRDTVGPDRMYNYQDLLDISTAVNSLNEGALNPELIDDMYRDSDNPIMNYMSQVTPMEQGVNLPVQDVGMAVRPGDQYLPSNAYGGSGFGTESFNLPEGYGRPGDSFGAPVRGRGNPYIQDQSYTTTGPSTDEDLFFQEIDSGGPGQAFTYTGPRISQMGTGPDSADIVYPGFTMNYVPGSFGQYDTGTERITYPRFSGTEEMRVPFSPQDMDIAPSTTEFDPRNLPRMATPQKGLRAFRKGIGAFDPYSMFGAGI